MASSSPLAINDLTQLVTDNGSSRVVYPSEESVLDVLQQRFRAEHMFTWIRDSTLVSFNPFRVLDNTSDAAKQAYENSYRLTSLDEASPPLSPHVYELAVRVYLMMRRRLESQSVVFRWVTSALSGLTHVYVPIGSGITNSGKSYNARLLSAQLLRLSSHSRKDIKLADQIRAFESILESFGHAKTATNPSATSRGAQNIVAAQVLASGLDKSRLVRLSHD